MSEATDTLIELTNVRKEFGDVVAVDGVSFEVERGEFFSLVGPSGCGKTTTLRTIAGFEQATDGTVRLDGEDAGAIPPDQRDTNLVFQHLSLFPHMTVGENVGYGLEKGSLGEDVPEEVSPQQHKREKIAEYLDLVDLGGYEDRMPSELSGGQQQRVALARALINEPSVVLLDEPLASLDRKLRKQMQVELRSIHEQTQGSFFYVTHDQEVAMTLSDRIAVMNDGRLEQVGTPMEVYREPATRFVAEFIGDTNVLTGQLRRTGDRTFVEVGDGVSIETAAVGADGADGTPVDVSIRPEDFEFADGDGAIEGVVTERYFQGDRTQYLVEPDADALDVLTVIVHGRNASLDRGDHASVDVSPAYPVVFD